VIAQYSLLISQGMKGYRNIMENCLTNARILSKALEASGWYVCVSDIHRKKGEYTMKGIAENIYHGQSQTETSSSYNAGLPVVAFRLTDEFNKEYPHVHQSSVSTLLRAKQYIIPSEFHKILFNSNIIQTNGRAPNRLCSPTNFGSNRNPACGG